jgi:ribosomal protein S18 acetylase RimI-like enzyme
MVRKEIEDFDSFEFKQSLDIYKSSFPQNETRPIEKVVQMLKNDENYHLFTYLNDKAVVGISLMYIFRSLNIGFLDYIAIKPNYQRRGIGKELFEFTFEKFRSDVSNGIGLLIEVQKENVHDLEERNLREKRIRFYMRLGAKIMDRVNYILPPIQPGFGSEEMYLMIRPLGEIHYLPKESVLQYIEAIYSTIYQYEDKDLLNLISQKLPARIMLRNVVSYIGSSS